MLTVGVAFAAAAAWPDRVVTLWAACLEIYNDELYDLRAQGGGKAWVRLICVEDANGTMEVEGSDLRFPIAIGFGVHICSS
jgi:hypothetical protein